MDIEKAFSVCNVEVTPEGPDAASDVYAATEIVFDTLKLEASREGLHNVPLPADTAVTVRSFQQDAVYVMPGKVLHSIVGNTVMVLVEQTGEVQRVQRRKHGCGR